MLKVGVYDVCIGEKLLATASYESLPECLTHLSRTYNIFDIRLFFWTYGGEKLPKIMVDDLFTHEFVHACYTTFKRYNLL